MITVLYVETSTSGVVGGSFFSLLELIRALDKSRYQPIVLFRHEHFLLNDFRASGARVIIDSTEIVDRPLKKERKKTGKVKQLLWSMLKLFGQRERVDVFLNIHRGNPFAKRVMQLIEQYQVDLLHLNDGLTPSLSIIAVLPDSVPIIVHERKIRNYAMDEKRYLDRVDQLICISNAVASNLRNHFEDFKRLVTIPNPLRTNLDTILDSRKDIFLRWKLPLNAFVVVQIANIIHWKGHDRAIDAMAIVIKQHPEAFLLIVGGSPPGEENYEASLHNKVNLLGIKDNIIFCGFQEDIKSYYHAADVLVHVPSKPEPFGRSVLEAMQASKAVIAANSGGTAELVQHGVTGLLVSPEDTETLTSYLIMLRNNRPLRMQMGKAAQSRVQAEYTPFTIARRVESIYDALAKRKTCCDARGGL